MKIEYIEKVIETRVYTLDFDPKEYHEYLSGDEHCEETLLDYLDDNVLWCDDYYTEDIEVIPLNRSVNLVENCYKEWLNENS